VHGVKDRAQASADLGKGVLHTWWYFRIDGPRDQIIRFHLPELLGQHLLADTGHTSGKLPEALGSGKDLPKNQNFPLISY